MGLSLLDTRFTWHLLRANCNYSNTEATEYFVRIFTTSHSYLFNTDPDVGFGAFPSTDTNYTHAFPNMIRGYPVLHNVTVSIAEEWVCQLAHLKSGRCSPMRWGYSGGAELAD